MADKWLVDQEHPDGYLVPMTAEEEAQLERDRAEHAKRERADKQAADERAALLAKLAGGTASPTEVQQALAQLLGGST